MVALRSAAAGIPTWVILDDGVGVGACGLHNLLDDTRPRSVEIGYGVLAVARGRGVGAHAVMALLDELRRLEVDEVTAEVELDSPDVISTSASQAILTGLGFLDLGDIAYPSGHARRFRLTLKH